ncbi:pilus assembly PilX N-terminal domain-containing protein [Thermodesulfitimonas autotrophica]|uniref:pilus assembly PilX N-terminal domain-containing protein n=1 Tax=Thermodesulfitimonas autotrophica TaxID=1894989 RepID=UPI002FE1CB17
MRSEKGQATLLAVMVIAIIVILGTAGLTLATYSKRAASGSADGTRAYYAAEAGVERAIAQLKVDPLWRDGFTDVPFGGGTIESVVLTELSRTAAGVQVKIASTGTYRKARKKVEAQVTVRYDPFISYRDGGVNIAGEGSNDNLTLSSSTPVVGDSSYPTNLVFGGREGSSTLTLSVLKQMGCRSGPVVYGNVFTRGNVGVTVQSGCMGGSTAVVGDVWANGTISAPPGSITGTPHPYAGLDIPHFPANIDPTDAAKKQQFIAYYTKVAQSCGSGHYFSGDHSFTRAELQNMSGVYFVNGKATIAESCTNYTGRATIVAATYIELPNYVDLQTSDPGAVRGLLSLQDTFMRGNNVVDGVILCGDTLCFNGSATTRGAIAVWGLGVGSSEQGGHRVTGRCCYTGSGDVKLRYDQNLFLLYPPGLPYTVKVDYWKQVS